MIQKHEETMCELFCGAGGMGYGFNHFFDITCAIDHKPETVKTYKANHPTTDVKNHDIRNLTGCKGDFQAIIGGPPCQGSSVINTKRYRADPRNELMTEFIRLISEIKPNLFVMENVPGVAKEKKAEIINFSKQAGFTTQSLFLNSADYGSAQMRKRWIVIGTKDKHWHIPQHKSPRTVRDAFATLNENWGIMKSSERTINALKLSEPNKWTAMNNSKFKNMIRLTWDTQAPAIVNLKKVYMVHPEETRNISLAEAAVIQGFPTNYIWHGTQSQIAQMIANAIPTELSYAIAEAFTNTTDQKILGDYHVH